MDTFGEPIEGQQFVAARDGGEDKAFTKGEVDGYWGNIAMYGALGTYDVSMVGPSDSVVGVGFGVETFPHGPAPTSFKFTYQLMLGTDTFPVPTPVEPPTTEIEDILIKMRRLRDAWELGIVRPLGT